MRLNDTTFFLKPFFNPIVHTNLVVLHLDMGGRRLDGLPVKSWTRGSTLSAWIWGVFMNMLGVTFLLNIWGKRRSGIYVVDDNRDYVLQVSIIALMWCP